LARHNTLAPLEVILLNAPGPEDRLPGGDSEEITLSIRNVPAGGRQSPAGAANDAAGMALYPNLLFLAAEVVFTRDILPLALAQLDDPEIGVVGMRLDDYPPSLPFFETPGVRHLGVRFFHDPAAMLYRPRVVKLANRDEAWDIPSGLYPAVGEGFFLCRRTDFATLHGFSPDYGKGYEYLDFCLRMSGQLGRKILCINEPGLEISRGSVDSPAFSGSGSQPDRNLHLLNERAGDQLGEPGTFLEPSSGIGNPEDGSRKVPGSPS